jgi:hypothetical protein
MVAGNVIIHGRTVDDWRQLAKENRMKHSTPEELAAYIDWHKSNEDKDALNPVNIESTRRGNMEKAKVLLDYYESLGQRILECRTVAEFQIWNEHIERLEFLMRLMEIIIKSPTLPVKMVFEPRT